MTIQIIDSTNSIDDNTAFSSAVTLGNPGDVLIVSASGYVLEEAASLAIFSNEDDVKVIVDGYVATAADPDSVAAISLFGISSKLTVNGTVIGSINVAGADSDVTVEGSVTSFVSVTGDDSDLTIDGKVDRAFIDGIGSTLTLGIGGKAGYLNMLNTSANAEITVYGQAGGVQLNDSQGTARIMSTGLVTGFGINLFGDYDRIVCNGTIDNAAGHAITNTASNTKIVVGAGGTIVGEVNYDNSTGGTANLLTNNGLIINDEDNSTAIFLSGGNKLVNHGAIDSGGFEAVHLEGSTVLNTGTISADNIAFSFTGGDNKIMNSGTVQGTLSNLLDATGSIQVENSGTWSASYLETTKGNDKFTNTGHVSGDVFLGAGLDIYDGQNGQIKGSVYGGAGTDFLIGGAGDDNMIGGAGGDEMTGGAGSNTLGYSDSSAGVTINLRTGFAAGGDAADDTFSKFQNITGSAFADNLTGNGADNDLVGADAADTLSGAGGDDYLGGDNGNDNLSGGAGLDTLVGGALQDTMSGGADSDIFFYGAVSDSATTKYDIITDFNAAEDWFDLSVSVTGFDTAVTGVALSKASIATDITTAAQGHLHGHKAMLVTASSGSLAGHTFLVVDCNGASGYQSGSDMLIDITGYTGTLTTANFT